MSRETIMQMTTEELRLEIAKNKGWTVIDGASIRQQEWLKDIPDWPTDIAVAWELVEEMRPTHRVNLHDYSTGWQCTAEIRDGSTRMAIGIAHPGDVSAKADTAEVAICRAWLCWKEGV